ncbi:DUF6124 family protein [Pseudomonas nunensis]|uniref:DUF6124 family protein n=1 Tax=Pseudomonas nunensis TaxID=2961896 RepID=A0ABY5EG29_9PSED|nr:DUF6124 family protein [Pseudomonas nunensis]KPN89336.1 hypothetical protein AL066_24890 [Pseudomonas nunensis]MCL5228765.1 DUF6124 family protein [Pseudomonas nunensis]UTO13670.1 DUF6124 family protein [Pseudomonas nunensis]
MHKITPNPPDNSGTDSPEALDAEKMKEAADRAFAHYFPPAEEKRSKRQKYQLFAVAEGINDPEAMLANASEDLMSISAIAADLADDVEGTRRSVVLAISRLSDGVQLLVERVLDHHQAMAEAKV